MIIFPHTYHYRLIIGSLFVAFIALGVYSYVSVSKLDEYNSYISQEKKLLENELSEMIIRYENIRTEDEILNERLTQSKVRIIRILDSVKAVAPSASLLSYYRAEIKDLQDEKDEVLDLLAKSQEENKRLQLAALEAKLNFQSIKNTTKNLKVKNKDLAVVNTALSNKIDNASFLEIEQLEAQAVKRITKKRIVSTEKYKKANKLHVAFTVSKNKFVDEGDKYLYLQILSPSNNIVADEGSVNFGKESLIYTKKIKVAYNKEDVEVETIVTTDEDQPFTKGVYFVNVFNDNKRLGSTSITLK